MNSFKFKFIQIDSYKIFIRSNFDYGNVSLITAEMKHVYKWEQIQMKALRLVLNLRRGINNNAVKKILQGLGIKTQYLTTQIYKNLLILFLLLFVCFFPVDSFFQPQFSDNFMKRYCKNF